MQNMHFLEGSSSLSQNQNRDHFDGDPFSASNYDYGLHNIHGLQAGIESDRIREIQRKKDEAERAQAERDPSGSMKLKAEADAEAKKLGIERD